MRISDWSSDVALPIYAGPDGLCAREAHVLESGVEALVGLVALEHPHRLALRPVEQCGHQRRGGVACERHELARLVVAGRHVDHRANERHRLLGEVRSEEHPSELQSLMRSSNSVCLCQNKQTTTTVRST